MKTGETWTRNIDTTRLDLLELLNRWNQQHFNGQSRFLYWV